MRKRPSRRAATPVNANAAVRWRQVEKILLRTEQRNCIRVTAIVRPTDNAAARQLYADFGFVAVGRRPCYYSRLGGPADALVLRRMITAEPSAART